jgi:hypothetical protein
MSNLAPREVSMRSAQGALITCLSTQGGLQNVLAEPLLLKVIAASAHPGH